MHQQIILINTKINNIMENTEKMFRLMNHDSSHSKPTFESYTIEEHNKQFGTNYTSISEAIESEPEYLFNEKDMLEYLN